MCFCSCNKTVSVRVLRPSSDRPCSCSCLCLVASCTTRPSPWEPRRRDQLRDIVKSVMAPDSGHSCPPRTSSHPRSPSCHASRCPPPTLLPVLLLLAMPVVGMLLLPAAVSCSPLVASPRRPSDSPPPREETGGFLRAQCPRPEDIHPCVSTALPFPGVSKKVSFSLFLSSHDCSFMKIA